MQSVIYKYKSMIVSCAEEIIFLAESFRDTYQLEKKSNIQFSRVREREISPIKEHSTRRRSIPTIGPKRARLSPVFVKATGYSTAHPDLRVVSNVKQAPDGDARIVFLGKPGGRDSRVADQFTEKYAAR